MANAPTPTAKPPGPTSNQDGTMIDYGASVRMERDSVIQLNGQHLWTVYTLVPVTDGTHPMHDQPTTDPAVWVPQMHGDEAAARAKCQQLSGISG